MRDFSEKVEFQIVELTKTKRPAKTHISFILHKFEQDALLDVITCLKTYIKCAKPLRRDASRKCSLLTSYTKPRRPVVACSIARWLKAIMTRAGIDTSIFKAHSTRAASTSKATSQGFSTNQISKCANWARASTFQKCYDKPVEHRGGGPVSKVPNIHQCMHWTIFRSALLILLCPVHTYRLKVLKVCLGLTLITMIIITMMHTVKCHVCHLWIKPVPLGKYRQGLR